METKQAIIDLINMLIYCSTQDNDADTFDGHSHDLFDAFDTECLEELRDKLLK